MSRSHLPTHPKRVLARQRQERALELRMGGKTYAAIGDELGVSSVRAGQYVHQALAETAKEIAEHSDRIRAQEAERMRELFNVLRPMAEAGDLRAIDRYVKVSESYRKLTGIDLRPPDDVAQAPTVVEVRFPWDQPGGDVVESTAEEIPEIPPGNGDLEA